MTQQPIKVIINGDIKIAMSIMQKGLESGLTPDDWTIEGNYATEYLELTAISDAGAKYIKRAITRLRKNKKFDAVREDNREIEFREYWKD